MVSKHKFQTGRFWETCALAGDTEGIRSFAVRGSYNDDACILFPRRARSPDRALRPVSLTCAEGKAEADRSAPALISLFPTLPAGSGFIPDG